MYIENKLAEFRVEPGSTFQTEITSFSPESGFDTQEFSGQIEDIRGGGFYGKVLMFEDSVIKTALPDPWHELWRHVNWRRPFPPQAYETAAILDHLSSTIIEKSMPLRNIIVPKSYGYTELGSLGFGQDTFGPLGFAQLIERVHGRQAKFDKHGRENKDIANARKWIWEIGKVMGFESAAQVHPDNPLGKPNLWLTDDEQIVWLDVLPAMRHTGFVLPLYSFGFHRDANAAFGRKNTFNRVHTSRLRSYIQSNPNLYSPSLQEELFWYMEQYDQFLQDYELLEGLDRKSAWELSTIKPDVMKRAIQGSFVDFAGKLPLLRGHFD